jgi:hypothetical protein
MSTKLLRMLMPKLTKLRLLLRNLTTLPKPAMPLPRKLSRPLIDTTTTSKKTLRLLKKKKRKPKKLPLTL